MLQRGTATERASAVAVSRTRQAKPAEEGLSSDPGELVPAEKVEEVLHGLDLPATGSPEDNLRGDAGRVRARDRGGGGAGRGEASARRIPSASTSERSVVFTS